MKVICIDNKPHGLSIFEESLKKLKEGGCYTVLSESEDGYYLLEAKSSHPTGEYIKSRFVIISSIDETEMIREYNLTPEKLKAHSISWYTERLKTETRIEARSFLRSQLYFLKKKVES